MSRSLAALAILVAGSWAQADFVSAMSMLNSMRGDVETHEQALKQLMSDKRRAEDPQVLRRIMDQIVKSYGEMEKAVEEYEKLRARTKIRYPSHRAQMKKYHPRYQFRPLEQLMKDDGVPKKLDELSAFMTRQYGKHSLDVAISSESRGNIEGEMKAYQTQLKKQQSGMTDWNTPPIIHY